MPWYGLKIEIYDFNQYGCSPEKVFIYEKKMENSWNGLKIEIYDLHQYSCSPKKVFHFELEPFGSLLSPIHGHTYSKCIFTIQGVLKMKNAMIWAKNWDKWLQLI